MMAEQRRRWLRATRQEIREDIDYTELAAAVERLGLTDFNGDKVP